MFSGPTFYRKSDVNAIEEKEKKQWKSDCVKLDFSSFTDPELISYVAEEQANIFLHVQELLASHSFEADASWRLRHAQVDNHKEDSNVCLLFYMPQQLR